jgi:hypothetical protein
MLTTACPLLPRTDFVHYALLCRATGMRPSVAHYGRWLPAQMARRRLVEHTALTLNEALALNGFTTRKARGDLTGYSKDILDGAVVVFTGRAHDVWAWLRAEGYIS